MVVATRPRQRAVPAVELDRDQTAYLDFAGSLRGLVLRTLVPALKRDFEQRAIAEAAAGRPTPESLDAVDALIGATQGVRWRGLLQYQSQQLRVRRLHEIAESQLDRIRPDLEAQPDDVGQLELDPDLRLPDYYTSTWFHTSPAGYYRAESAGVTYDVGLAIYRLQTNYLEPQRSDVVDALPDEGFADILDLGCGTATPTLALARRFPQAGITGIDLAAPLLRMAHAKFEAAGLPARFLQANAESTGLAGASFDLIFAQILFHEVPGEAAATILAEARRLLRRGGLMIIADVEPYATLDPFDRYSTDWQTENNEEPFWREWGQTDAIALLRRAGYAQAWQQPVANPMAPGRYQYLTFARA